MPDFIQSLGPAYLGNLLARLQDRLLRGFEEWYAELGLLAPPRTYSTLRLLEERGPMPVTGIAEALSQSHPLVITWIRTLRALGLVETAADPADGRRTVVSLTPDGRGEVSRQRSFETVTLGAMTRLFDEADAQVMEPLWRIERALRESGFADRLRTEALNRGAHAEGRAYARHEGRS